MPDAQDIEHQQKLLAAHRRTLALFEEQRAALGPAFIPPGVATGIHEARSGIRQAKAALRGWGIPVDDRPDDEEAADAELSSALASIAALPLDGLPEPAPLPRGSRMPFRRNPLFTGRAGDLRALAATLKAGDTAVIAAATGLGGIGKTQLAAEFVHRYGQFFAGGVFWLSFADARGASAEIAACGGSGAMALFRDDAGLTLEQQWRAVLAEWSGPPPRLLVFDNCEDEALLDEWRPKTGGCRVLLTSRRAEWDEALGVQAIRLGVLPREESVALLRKFRPDLAIEDNALGGSALPIEDNALSPGSARPLADNALSDRSALPIEDNALGGSTLPIENNALGDRSALPIENNALSGRPALPIEDNVMYGGSSVSAPGDAKAGGHGGTALQEIAAELGDLPLALHLARSYLKHNRHDVSPDEYLTELRSAELLKHPSLEGEDLTVSATNHALHVGRTFALSYDQLDAAKAVDSLALALLARAARSLNNLGYLLRAKGDLEGARPYYEQALDIFRAVLGERHPDTARSLNNLAVLCFYEGKFQEAAALIRQALAIREEVLGRSTPTRSLHA